MADWATYVIVREDGDHEVYEARFGAIGLDLDLLAGPEVLVPVLRARPLAEDWRDEVWCQAAALIDLRCKTLLFFAWEGPVTELRHRAALWEALRRAWPGWELRWTHDGPAALRAHLGLDPEVVREKAGGSTYPDGALATGDEELAERDPLIRVVTVGADRCHLLSSANHHPVAEGPALLVRLERAPGHGRCVLAANSGLHVDPLRRRVGWWLLGAQAGVPRMASRWPGWTVEFWADRWEEHVRASGGRFAPPAVDPEQALAELRDEARGRRSALGDAVLRLP
ncbi:hypothetical protein [Streptomyces sp. NPDC026673]|uniref:hypothetical protein n=1 Tax=Streptomyces sp. NPDC026673 TaxID=3155724 RepID=UPI0033FDA5F6